MYVRFPHTSARHAKYPRRPRRVALKCMALKRMALKRMALK